MTDGDSWENAILHNFNEENVKEYLKSILFWYRIRKVKED